MITATKGQLVDAAGNVPVNLESAIHLFKTTAEWLAGRKAVFKKSVGRNANALLLLRRAENDQQPVTLSRLTVMWEDAVSSLANEQSWGQISLMNDLSLITDESAVGTGTADFGDIGQEGGEAIWFISQGSAR